MKKVISILLTIALVFAMGAVTVFADNETVTITSVAELQNAIANQLPGQTWNIAAGVYDISPNNTILQGGQTGWYFPIFKDGITINGAGIDQTVITSSVLCKNGVWATQDMISVWSDNVTIKNLTIRPKLETNKAIEVMGKNFKAQNIAIRNNVIVTDAAYCALMGYTAGSANDDYGRFGGSVYFNPQNAGKDIGTATLDNVLITQAWISCRTDTVSAGTLNLTGGTTIDFRNSFYAGMAGFGVISSNPSIIQANNFKVIYDDKANVQQQITDRVPTGTTLIKANTEVIARADVTYTVIIPASVDFGTINKSMTSMSKDFTVKVEGALLEDGYSVKVENTTASMVMKDKNGTGNKTLGFALTPPSGNFIFAGDGTQNGAVSCNPSQLTAAGSYKGYMTFSVTYGVFVG